MRSDRLACSSRMLEEGTASAILRSVLRVAVCSAGPGPVLTDLSCPKPDADARGAAVMWADNLAGQWAPGRNRFLPHQMKEAPAAPSNRTPAMMGRRAGSPEPGSRPGVTAATRLAWADLVTGVFQSCPLEAPVGGGEPADPVAAGDGPAAVSSGSAAGAEGTGSVPAGGVSEGAGCSGGAGTGSTGGAGGLSGSLGFRVRAGSAGSVLCAGPDQQTRRHWSGDVVDTGVGSGESAAAGPPGKRPRVMARTAADAVVEATRKTGEDGVIATFRCAQSPTAAFWCPR
jgi:hypothetical protein